MTAASVSLASRRRLFTALSAAVGRPRAAMRRSAQSALAAGPVVPFASTPPSPVRWLQKATFGYSARAKTAFDARPGANDDARWQNWVDWQLNPSAIADAACESRLASAGFLTLNKTLPQLWADHHDTGDYATRMLPVAEAECATTIRAVYSERQLFEVLVDFWHDHFSVFGWDYDGAPLFPDLDRGLRTNAFGNFRQMLEQVCRSTTMMYSLDLYASTRAGPNENYARELLELHTLGAEHYFGPTDPLGVPCLDSDIHCEGGFPQGYVDNDVYEAAAALTGWTIKDGNWQFPADDDGTFVYRSEWHDRRNKIFLGRYLPPDQPAMQDGFDVFDRLCAHPNTARHVVRKLCRRLVGDNPPSSLVDSAAALFTAQAGAADQIAQVVRAILVSDAFKNAWGGKVKRPFNSFAGALRALDADFTPTTRDYPDEWPTSDELASRLQQAGHRLFYWPAPNGYPDQASAWSSTGALAMSWKLLTRLTTVRQQVGYDDTYPYVADVVAQTNAAIAAGGRSANAVVGYWCDRILGSRPEPVRGKAVDFLRQNATADEALDLEHNDWAANDLKKHYTQDRLRSTVALILCSPDFFAR
ncbi:DUF1800 domain-containing protein [Dokdonella ginsengisoli]|uniref:DUF1800 domain-containing protein n=1 Tax=Dokdonella ginsengisoli TaxID=363846 RepID=A0ABV9QY66_9GAMM